MGIATLIASAAMMAANAQTAPAAPVAPDLTTIDGTIKELYAVISRPTPGTRDWDRFKNLFDPYARIVVNGMSGPEPAKAYYGSLSPDEYKTYNATVLERTAFLHPADIVEDGVRHLVRCLRPRRDWTVLSRRDVAGAVA